MADVDVLDAFTLVDAAPAFEPATVEVVGKPQVHRKNPGVWLVDFNILDANGTVLATGRNVTAPTTSAGLQAIAEMWAVDIMPIGYALSV